MTPLPMISTTVSWAIKMCTVVTRFVGFLSFRWGCGIVASWIPTPEQVATFWISRVETNASVLWSGWCWCRCSTSHHQWSYLVRLLILIVLGKMFHYPLLSIALAVPPGMLWLFHYQLGWWLLRLCGSWFECRECRQAAIIRLIS